MYLLWGASYVGVKAMVETIPPLAGTSLRYVIAATVVALTVLVRPIVGTSAITRREMLGASVFGLLLLGGGTGLLTLGAPYIDASVAVLIFAAVPVWMALLTAISTGRISPRLFLFAGLGMAGVAVLFADNLGRTPSTLKGLLLVTAASLFWAVPSFYARRFKVPNSQRISLLFQMGAAAVALGIIAALAGQWGQLAGTDVTNSSIAGLLFVSLGASTIAYGAYQRLVRRHAGALVGTFAYVNPLVGVIAAALVLGERVTWQIVLAGVLILIAVIGTAATARRENLRPA